MNENTDLNSFKKRKQDRRLRIRRIADEILDGKFTIQGVTALQKTRDSGGYDWEWNGPNNNPEWSWFFNRHFWFRDLMRAYRYTKEEKYRDTIKECLSDWISQNPAPNRHNYTSAWRPLEAARRLLYVWLPQLDSWLDNPNWDHALKKDIISSLVAHGKHLRTHHALNGNHLITEMRALLTLGVRCHEFPDASEWVEYSLGQLERAYHNQVYPDGVHKELSSHYHRIITENFSEMPRLLKSFSDDRHSAKVWERRIKEMWAYLYDITKPNGTNPINNDSDIEDFDKIIAKSDYKDALSYSRVTKHYPWAGQTVFRGRRREDWAFFDHGPNGTDHEHMDYNHLSLSVQHADFLVDSGRYTYEPSIWRDYFRGPAAHNVIEIDGIGSDPPGRAAKCRHFLDAFRVLKSGEQIAVGEAYFYGALRNRFADWRREVCYDIDKAWTVKDNVITFGSHALRTYWHFHPECEFEGHALESDGLIVTNGEQRLHIYLKTDNIISSSIRVVRGQGEPEIQGWYSPRFNFKEPAPVLILDQRFTGPSCNEWKFSVLA